MTHRLHADAVTLRYDARTISTGLSLAIPDGSFTVIVGPNACGKSTLLRALSRLLAPAAGRVVLDGREISALPAREVARRLGLLPQSATAPDGISVADLVGRGRYPHQSFLRQWSRADEEAVAAAMAAMGIADLADRLVDELSGGQRQRVWIAMVLAQETPILLLDEPTTFLDIAHQIELLDLLADLNRQGRTVVAVLHELNHACRYATHLVAMREGAILAEGAVADIVTEAMVRDVFGLASLVIADPVSGTPLIVPRGRSPKPPADENGTESAALPADFREMRVLRVAELTPRLRRITLTGSDLSRFATDEALHVRLFFPPPGVNSPHWPPHWPRRGADGLDAGTASEPRPAIRRYTIRRVDPGSGEVDIDFVLHGKAAPGAGWAARAAVGDLLGMAGPGGGGFRPAEWYLLAGDETALPAIARILEALPAEAEGVALVSVADPREMIPLATASRVELRYIDRSTAAPGARCLLAEAVRTVTPPRDRSSYVWAGCEYDDFRAIRSHFRTVLKRKRGDHLAVSYWRRGRAEDDRAG